MAAEKVQIEEVAWRDQGDVLTGLRQAVFIEEQGVSREIERDGLDETATHFLAREADGTAIGTARLLSSGQIGRMAVKEDRRGAGTGSALLRMACEAARRRGLSSVFVHAQVRAAGLYRRAGFASQGAPFEEAGISHIKMVRQLVHEP